MGIAAGLLVGAGIWVALLAATSGNSPPEPNGATANPATGGAKADRATVKFIDKANFYSTDPNTGDPLGEVALRLDVVDAAGQPITDLRPEDVQVTEGDLPGRIKSFRGPATQAVNVILVLDISGSMREQGRIAGARKAAHAALNALKAGRDRIGLVAFDNRYDFRAPFETLTDNHREKCTREIDRLRPRAGTAIGPPVVAALREFESSKPNGLKMVLLMTDGDDNERDEFARLRNRIGELSDKLGVQVHAISVGDEVSSEGEEDLRDVALKGNGRYEHSPSPERLAELFRSRIAETVNECSLVYDSPYPTADGFDRPITVTIRTPSGPLTATASYKIGPLLSARSKPAAWALAAPAAPQTGASSNGPRMSGGIRGPLFMVLLVALLAALAVPAFWRKAPAAEPAPAVVVPSGPQSIRPPPPPPRVNGSASVPAESTAPRATPVAAPAAPRPATGTVLKPPPPPPPKKG